ncbi:hypothetical protein C8K38_12386 [Rhodococcus sp. OK611]|nr:hypothetical protein C8K38_12386 [Rhodococcus sp. OK611]SNX93787.1 hypothetical protein SAMN05447004_12386 [Rhodococcus sp. OK270]
MRDRFLTSVDPDSELERPLRRKSWPPFVDLRMIAIECADSR